MVIVTGSGPQLNVMIPPAPTADTTAAEVQLSGLPLPMTLVGFDVSTARASAGTVARPLGLPCAGIAVAAAALAVAFGVAGTDGAALTAPPASLADGALDACLAGDPPQPASARTTVVSAAAAVRRRIRRSYDRPPGCV
jgi:hypothetical protein